MNSYDYISAHNEYVDMKGNSLRYAKRCSPNTYDAGSVVVKSIPSDEIWGGNPAIFIKKKITN